MEDERKERIKNTFIGIFSVMDKLAQDSCNELFSVQVNKLLEQHEELETFGKEQKRFLVTTPSKKTYEVTVQEIEI